MSYKISFQKNQLGFLKSYLKVADKDFGRYLIVNLSKESDGKYMSFELSTKEVDVVTKLKNDSVEFDSGTEMSLTFPLSDFYNFVSLLSDDESVTLADSIFKTKKGEYPIRELSQEIARQSIVSLVDNAFTSIKLTQLEKLKILKGFIGSDIKGQDAILFQGGNYSAFGESQACTVIGDGSDSEPVYLSPRMVEVLDMIDSESVTLNLQKTQNIIVIRHDDTIYFFKVNKKYKVPDLMSDTFKSRWLHDYPVKVKFNDFLNVLNKFKVLSSDESIKLLYKFKLENGNMMIQTMNNQSGSAFESIEAVIPDELNGLEFPLSVGHTLTALKAFNPKVTENIYMYLKPYDETKAVKWVSSFGVRDMADEKVLVVLPTLSQMM